MPRPKMPAAEPIPLRELIRRLEALDALSGLERAHAARDGDALLARVARASIAAAGDQGIWEAKRQGMSYKDIMAAMEYADDGPVARAITAHNKRR